LSGQPAPSQIVASHIPCGKEEALGTYLDVDLALLLKTPLFSGFDVLALAPILKTVSTCTYAKGETVFHAGDPANRLFVVMSGWITLSRTTRDGEEAIIGLFMRGETFAEAAMFLSRGFPATAVAGTRTRLLAIDARTMLAAMRNDPDLALRMLASMSAKLKTFVEHITLTRLRSPQHRVAEFLLGLCAADEGCETIDLPFEKQLIATRLAMRPASFSRALRGLRDRLET
jgi:CRP/FNR family transcriptional regulator, dissimilatory nitrate respiration regulator